MAVISIAGGPFGVLGNIAQGVFPAVEPRRNLGLEACQVSMAIQVGAANAASIQKMQLGISTATSQFMPVLQSGSRKFYWS